MGKPNALFLAAEFLPKFNFVEGSWETASRAIFQCEPNARGSLAIQCETNARESLAIQCMPSDPARQQPTDPVVITLMLSNARNLHVGDKLVVKKAGRPRPGSPAPVEELSFPIVGVVDLNWHMVTSR